MSIDELEQVVQRAAAVVFGNLLAVLVDEERRKSVYVLLAAQVAVLLQRAVDFGDFDVAVSDELLGQLAPSWLKSLAVSTFKI